MCAAPQPIWPLNNGEASPCPRPISMLWPLWPTNCSPVVRLLKASSCACYTSTSMKNRGHPVPSIQPAIAILIPSSCMHLRKTRKTVSGPSRPLPTLSNRLPMLVLMSLYHHHHLRERFSLPLSHETQVIWTRESSTQHRAAQLKIVSTQVQLPRNRLRPCKGQGQ